MIKVSVMYPNTPGAPATYVGMGHIFADSVESFQAGFGRFWPARQGHPGRYSQLHRHRAGHADQ